MIVGIPTEVKVDEYRVAVTPAGRAGARPRPATPSTSRRAPATARPCPTPSSSGPGPHRRRRGRTLGRRRPGLQGQGAGGRGVPPARPAPRPDVVHLPPPGRVRECTDACSSPPATSPSPTRRCATPDNTLAAAGADERGGRPHGAAHGGAPPDASRRWPGRPRLRCARRPQRAGRDPRRRRGGLRRGHHGRRHALGGLHPRPEPRSTPRGRPPLPRCARDGRLVRSTRSRRCAWRPTSSSGPCWSWAPGRRTWCRMRWSSGCVPVPCSSTSRWTRAGASSRPGPTTHSNPTFEVHGTIFYCVANMPGAVPHTSTHALANATLPYTLSIADQGWKQAVRANPALAEGVNVVDGKVVYKPVADAHDLDYTPLAGLVG